MPVADRESASINNFSKWEQAFRIFSNIYTRFYPHRATKLVQYNHIIYTVASTYVWENVYTYDCEFWMHLSNFPQRNWSIILQQAWAMYLKDKLVKDDFKGNNSKGKYNKEKCCRFNKGTCPDGMHCNYDHRCNICGKFGHGAHICRKRKQVAAHGQTS